VCPVGDSITEGYLAGGAIDGGYRVPMQTLVGSRIRQIGPYLNNGLRHNGVGGSTIAGVTARISVPATGIGSGSPYRPRVIVLIIGTNDANSAGYNGATAAAALGTLLATIESLEPEVRLVVMSSLPTLTTIYAANAADFNGRIGAVLDASAIHLDGRMVRVDVGSVVTAAHVAADGVHPNAAGYAALAAALWPAVQTAMVL
jgi:lysophospholipase L1-like esterase